MMNDMMTGSKIDVLKNLIEYMRKLEAAKDEPEDALHQGMQHAANEMKPEDEETMADEMAESPEEQKQEEESGEEEHPFAANFKDFLNDRHLPKVGGNVTMMVEAKKEAGKPMAAEIEMRKGKKKKYMR